MRRMLLIARRTAVAFYDNQITHHAAAMTYYALMSLFPSALLGLSLLGLLGQYPETYDAIVGYLRDVVPEPTMSAVDESLRTALQNKGTAATGVMLGIVIALYGTTGALEASRRALNVVFEVEQGRSFLRRKSVDVAMSAVLMGLVLVSVTLVFVGGGFAEEVFGLLGLGETAAAVWSIARWPLAVLAMILLFALVYWIVPDVRHRSFRWITPGAVVAVLVWMAASSLFSFYLSSVPGPAAIYGAFTGAIILVAWIWLSGVALLLGAVLDAEIERQKEVEEGVRPGDTLAIPAKSG